MKKLFRNNYKWIIFLMLVSAGSMFAELINNKLEMVDLEVYYKAADRLIHGSDLYRGVEENPNEHYVYKYAPPAALLFIPLLPLGFGLAKYVYWIILTFILGSVLFNTRIIFKQPATVFLSLILGIIIIGTHFFRELHLGQVNLLMMGIYIYALILLENRRPAGFGAIIALSIFIKPFGLIFIPLLLLMRRFREIGYMLGFIIIFLLIPFIFYWNIADYTGLYQSWIEELSIELGNKQDLAAAGNHTIFSVMYRYTPLSFIHLGGISRNIYQLAVLSLLGVYLLWIYFARPVPDRDKRLYIGLIAMIPLLAYTSYNAFIFSLPVILFLLFKFREMNIAFRIVFIISCLLIGANIYDVMGRELFFVLWNISVYTWGTLGLLVTLFYNWNRFSTRSPEINEQRTTNNE